MTLKEFTELQRAKIMEGAQSEPVDKVWTMADTWNTFDWATNQIFLYDLPKSIELDPE